VRGACSGLWHARAPRLDGYCDRLPDRHDEGGDTLTVSSGDLAIFSIALDGAGPYSMPLLTAQPGPVLPVHGLPSRGMDPGLLFSTVRTAYKLKVRWYTELGEGNCFARWLLIPVRASG
jgi:hypothetical protein